LTLVPWLLGEDLMVYFSQKIFSHPYYDVILLDPCPSTLTMVEGEKRREANY